MKGKLIALGLAALMLTGCGQSSRHCGTDTSGHRVCGNSQVVRTSDGRYGMYGPDGFWYWYMLGTVMNGSGNHYYYGSGSTFAMPNGGSWVKSTAPSTADLTGSTSVPTDITLNSAGSFSSDVTPNVATEVEETAGSFTSGGSSSSSNESSGSYSSGSSSSSTDESSGSMSSGGSDESSSSSSSDESSGSMSSGDSGSSSPESSSSSSSDESSGSMSSGDPE